MKLFSDQETLEKELTHIIHDAGPQLGLVSSNAPLISQLVVWQNIALICAYKQNIPVNKARVFVLQCLSRIELECVADKQISVLTAEERFLVMLLRAAMVSNAIIVIDRPFTIMHYLEDISLIYKTLGILNDLFSQCFILGYNHEKNKYGVLNASES